MHTQEERDIHTWAHSLTNTHTENAHTHTFPSVLRDSVLSVLGGGWVRVPRGRCAPSARSSAPARSPTPVGTDTDTLQTHSQVAEQLGNRATIQKVACSIPGRAKLRCVLGQGTSPYLPRGNVPVLTVSLSG